MDPRLEVAYTEWLNQASQLASVDWWQGTARFIEMTPEPPKISGLQSLLRGPAVLKPSNTYMAALEEKFTQESEMFQDALYEAAQQRVGDLDLDQVGLWQFTNEFSNFWGHEGFPYSGFFLSALINQADILTTVILVAADRGFLEGIGAFLKNKLVVVPGEKVYLSEVGYKVQKGAELIVVGDVHESVGFKNNGRIVIHGDLHGLSSFLEGETPDTQGAGSAGDRMEDGEIWLCGKGLVSPFIHGGKVYRHRKQIYPVRQPAHVFQRIARFFHPVR